MNWNRLSGRVVAVAIAVLTAGEVLAQATILSGPDPALAAREQELAAITADRGRVVREIIDQWRSSLRAANPALNDDGGLSQFTAALLSTAPEVLLAASRAQSYEELTTLLAGRTQDPSVIALEPGKAIPNTLGSTSGDLVFTPITPCRIFDTRVAGGSFAGKIGPGGTWPGGNWFSVNLANFSGQGGATSCPGMPTTFDPSAVAINVTSAGQTGVGNLRLVECGGGLPLVSLLNYTPGVNLANAAVVRSAIGCPLGPGGSNDLFVYSTNSASDVVVDLMGYYSAPEATALSCTNVTASDASVADHETASLTATCPAGYTVSGGGFYTNLSSTGGANGMVWYRSRPFGNGWNCHGQNFVGVTLTADCYAVCCRVPGR